MNALDVSLADGTNVCRVDPCDTSVPTLGCAVNGVRNQPCEGTAGDDLIIGTGDDVIVGLGGNDRIRGRRGNDLWRRSRRIATGSRSRSTRRSAAARPPSSLPLRRRIAAVYDPTTASILRGWNVLPR